MFFDFSTFKRDNQMRVIERETVFLLCNQAKCRISDQVPKINIDNMTVLFVARVSVHHRGQ